MGGFSNFKAFTGGLAGGIENAEEAKTKNQYAIDKDYREAALKVSVENEIALAQQKRDQDQAYKDSQTWKAMANQSNAQSTTDGLNQASLPPADAVSDLPSAPQVQGPQVQQSTPAPQNQVADASGAVTPTTPAPQQQTPPAPSQPQAAPQNTQVAQNMPQGQQPQGGMNSPQGSPVVLQQPQQKPETLISSEAPVDNILKTKGNLNDDDKQAIMGLAQEEKDKSKGQLSAEAAWNIATQKYIKQQNKDNLDNQKAISEIQKNRNSIEDKDTNVSKMGKDYQETVKALQNIGIVGQTSTLPKLDRSEESARDKMTGDAYTSYNGASQAITSYNSLLHISDDVINGPADKLQYEISASIDKMTGQEYSTAVDNWAIANKDIVQLANANVKSLGGAYRPGIGMLNFEKNGVPSTGMPPEAMKALIFQGLATARGLAEQSKALTSMPDQISATQRRAATIKYMEANPVLLSDGQTPNPQWKSWDDWKKDAANGVTSSAPTGQDIRGAGLPGGSPSPTAPKVIGTWNPATGKIE